MENDATGDQSGIEARLRVLGETRVEQAKAALVYLQEKHELDAKQLATLAGVDEMTAIKLIEGAEHMSMEQFHRVCDALGEAAPIVLYRTIVKKASGWPAKLQESSQRTFDKMRETLEQVYPDPIYWEE